jgi:hypothetical protein
MGTIVEPARDGATRPLAQEIRLRYGAARGAPLEKR